MAIIAIAILGIFGTMLANIRIAENTRLNDIAMNAAKSMIDRIRATSFDSIGVTFGDPNNTFNVVGLPRRPNGTPHGVIKFSQPPPPEPNPKDVAQGGSFQTTPIVGNLLNVRVQVFFSRVEVPAGGVQQLSENEMVVSLQTVIFTDSP